MIGSIGSGGGVVASALAPGAAEMLREVDAAPAGCSLVELRADHLRADEIGGLVRRCDRPVVVTIRRREDGGGFTGSEEERRRGLLAALDAGARYVDVEWGGALADLAFGDLASRVVLSHHGAACTVSELLQVHDRLRESKAARLKIVPLARSVAQILAVRDLLGAPGRQDPPLACFAMGRAGALSRLLALSWGSWATYGSVAPGRETAAGQFTALDLLETYEVGTIGTGTRWMALIGRHVFSSPSPAMHRAAHREAALDARYVPVELDEAEALFPLLEQGARPRIEALAVTMPFKEVLAARCEAGDAVARASGAVNTVLAGADGWRGYNTDGPAALAGARRHLDPRVARVAVVGAGGTARAVAASFHAAGARVTLYNRTSARASEAAASLGVQARGLDDLRDAGWDVLINASPLGGKGEEILPASRLGGRMIVDAVYGAGPTPLVTAAREAGLAVMDGLDLLVGQGLLQLERMTGVTVEPDVMARAARRWLAARPRP
jgi:3-dehydroquinate dehydratase/shikimate dehydrogenase